MEQARADREKPETEGEKYLRLLELGHLADRDAQTTDGTVFKVRDFLDICGEHARPMLIGFESMSRDDPRYERTLESLQGVVTAYIENPPG